MRFKEISVTLFFNEDLIEEEVDQVIEELDYKFNHQWIEGHRINGIIE